MNNTKRYVPSALDGTKTAENLRAAFEKEAINFAKGSIFSSSAQKDGNMGAKKVLAEQADNDKRLAELWLSYLDEIDDTLENLSELSSAKNMLSQEYYPVIAEIADEEGFEEIGEKLRLAGFAKSNHSRALETEHEKLIRSDAVYAESPDTPWLCTACGYIVKGNTPPDRCPLCSYPSEYFEKMHIQE